jgi:hypothetical protein
VKVAALRRQWLVSVVVYTAAGTLASVAVGSGLGGLGALFSERVGIREQWLAALVIGFLGVLKLIGVQRIPLPQWRRQTPEFWRFNVPMPVTAALWGLDLGLVFTTWLTYPGPWFLAAIALVGGSPAFGAVLFGAHWLGRAAWVWFAPYLLPTATSAPAVALAIVRSAPRFQRVHLVGLVIGVLAVGLVATIGR